MSALFWETVTPDMRSILGRFTQSELGANFYLAGGTALALHLGHRISVDLDFFSPTLADAFWGNLDYLARNVRIGFDGYGNEILLISLRSKPFPANCRPYFKACVYLFMRHSVVAPLVETQEARLASVEDIALMKLDALLARAAQKDFSNLYFICQKIPLRMVLDMAPRKSPSVRDFENAEANPDPQLISTVSWQQVKDFFVQTSKQTAGDWLA